ncbi:hypothetical protein CEXT_260791 [Caerostris extrusa]|uniref:Transposase n=1 Tax=Caerostris extrusa TaxID=172846 RepID=A0AAV4VFN1_CAEEX|nr:hypothetical protein CEXT_260791 [Caerostris extrusa]
MSYINGIHEAKRCRKLGLSIPTSVTILELKNLVSARSLRICWDFALHLVFDWIEDVRLEIITKGQCYLHTAHRLFDPFGIASPVMLCPKLRLQETWKMSFGRDEGN